MDMLHLDHAAASHVGRVRARNEDAFLAMPDQGLFVVADGMGGHEGGEWAAAALVARLRAAALPDDFGSACASLAAELRAVNRLVWAEGHARGARIGCTVVALLARGARVAVLWAGDSRAYLLRGGRITRLSRDHTQVQALVDNGLLTATDARRHPLNHVLARAVGAEQELHVDVVHDRVEPGDVLLLCSDGLTGSVDDAEIAVLAVDGHRQRAVDRLVDLTLARGAPDNVTVLAVGVARR